MKMIKRMDITLGDVEGLPLEIVGDHLIKYRRKKRPNKKSGNKSYYIYYNLQSAKSALYNNYRRTNQRKEHKP